MKPKLHDIDQLPAGYLHLQNNPEPELTEWIDGSKFVPFHKGSYETGYGEKLQSKGFQLWDGEMWGQTSESAESSISRPHLRGVDQVPFWRGLSKDPNQS